MFDVSFARALLRWATPFMVFGLSVLLLGAALGYLFAAALSMGWQAVGHFFIASGAFVIKVAYIARLAALDVLNPHPEGWISRIGLARTGQLALESRRSADAA